MKNLFFTLTIGTSLLFFSCGQDTTKKTDEGEIREQEYTSKELGWTMDIPEGWEIIDLEKTKKSTERGMKVIEESTDTKVDYSGLKNLITFQKDQFNIFQSSSEPFKLEYEGEWEEHVQYIKGLVYETYTNRGIKTDSSETTFEKINGLDFHVFDFTIYGPKGEVILKQIIYNRHINGFSFGANINYNNEKARDEMLKAFRSSTFNKRR